MSARQTAQLTYADQLALRRAIDSLPYGGLVRTLTRTDELDVDDLVRWLNSFAKVLAQQTDRHDKERRELSKLQRDVEGLRRIFGVGP
jgi:hypothetical protein